MANAGTVVQESPLRTCPPPHNSVLAWGENQQAPLGQGSTIYDSAAREIALPGKAVLKTNLLTRFFNE